MDATTKEDQLAQTAYAKLREAEKAWYAYYGELEVGDKRMWAAEVYERIRCATRRI
jgi:hypothetical protein